MIIFSRFALALVLLLWGSTQSFAACSPDTKFAQSDFIGYGTARAQLGLRAAFSTGPVVGLNDGTFGPITQDAMHDLCDKIPRPAGLDDRQSTLDVLVEFIALADVLGAHRLEDFDFDPTVAGSQALALASVPAITGRTLRGEPTAFECGDLDRTMDGSAIATRTLAALGRAPLALTQKDICGLFPSPADGTALRASFERLGNIDAKRPGALGVLASPSFRDWIMLDKPNRLRRLVASEDAVVTLIDEFNASSSRVGGTPYVSSSCTPLREERSTTFYSLSEEDIKTIKQQISLTTVLDGFAVDNPVYDSAGALWRDLEPVLQAALGACILSEIEPLVTGADQLPKSYGFRAGAASQLSANPVLADAKPILTDFEDRRFASKSEFLGALKAALTTAQVAKVDQIIELAADTMAAAAEFNQPNFDTARVIIPDEDLLNYPQADPPQLIVTEAADYAVQSLIDDRNLTSALQSTIITPSPVPEQIKTQVRESMQPAAQTRVAETVQTQVGLAEPLVLATWTLSPPLADAVKAVPYVRAAMQDDTGDDLDARLAPLIGIEYPTYRLFERALRGVAFEKGKTAFSNFVLEQVTMAAFKTVKQPEIVREFGPTAIEKCACIADRRDNNLRIYGFYPFWHAPLPSGDQTDGDDPSKSLHRIDFAQITDIAFYGLEFTYELREDGKKGIILHNEAQWHAAKWNFITSAHQQRARVDLAFDMRGWTEWNETAISEVVAHISTEVAPIEVFPNLSVASIRAGIPSIFDSDQVDGITLIFPDYVGYEPNDSKSDANKLVHIIKRIYEGLPDRNKLAINVAFDFPMLSDTPLENSLPPVLGALADLLVEKPYVVATNPDSKTNDPLPASTRTIEKVVDKVLLFLETPTTDAKKALRLRIEENLLFRGEQRETVLRSIIPVVPPGGHRLIRTSPLSTDPPNTIMPEYSQFKDDLVYFRDNFSGIGFWSTPHSKPPELDPISLHLKSELGPVQRQDQGQKTALETEVKGLEGAINDVCKFVCPNRAAIMLTVVGTFAVMLLLVRQAYYVGWAHRIAYRMFYYFGAVPAMNAVMLATLFALWKCDPLSQKPQFMFWGLLVTISLLWLFKSYQRIKNGPKP